MVFLFLLPFLSRSAIPGNGTLLTWVDLVQVPSVELYRLFKGEQKEVYVKSINQSTESNLKNGVVPLEE